MFPRGRRWPSAWPHSTKFGRVPDLLAPAKLTKSLRVVGVREDGYHLIDAEMVSISLFDRLRVDPAPPGGSALHVRRHYLIGPGQDAPREVGEPGDLVLRALAMAGREARVELTKNIPPGAGLGGGSSDAAAILRWAGWEDLDRAASLGADVAFCLLGGRAHVTGIGEDVRPLDVVAQTFTLLTPPVHASTPVVYRTWDEMGGPQGEHGNDLEPAAIQAYPELVPYRDRLAELSGQRPRLAGSGSTWFVEGAFEAVDTRIVQTFA